jgi:hypothetical protein
MDGWRASGSGGTRPEEEEGSARPSRQREEASAAYPFGAGALLGQGRFGSWAEMAPLAFSYFLISFSFFFFYFLINSISFA